MEVIGINEENVKTISSIKKEEDWVRDYRLDSYQKFENIGMPEFGPEIDLDFSKIIYYKNNDQDQKIQDDWNNILKPIVDDLDSVGVLESEVHMGGMGVQYESEVIYHSMLQEIEEKKVIFTSIERAMRDYPDLVQKYFGKIVRNDENKFAALMVLYFLEVVLSMFLKIQNLIDHFKVTLELIVVIWDNLKEL